MTHQVLGALDGGLGHTGKQVTRTAGPHDGLVEQGYGVGAHLPGGRMHVEHGRVAGRQHADAVVDDGAGGVGAGGNGANHPIGSPLDKGQPVVTGECLGLDDLGARRLIDHQQVLLDLVLVAPHARLLPGLIGQHLGRFSGRLTHMADDHVPPG